MNIKNFLLVSVACLLMPHAIMAVAMLDEEETQTTVTCVLPQSVALSLGVNTFSFLKLTEHSSMEVIFNEYTFGIYRQVPVNDLIKSFNKQAHNEWMTDDTLQLKARINIFVLVMRVSGLEIIEARQERDRALVFQALSRIRGFRGLMEFTSYLGSLEDSLMNRVFAQALGGPLVVTVLDATVRVELPGYIASVFGVSSFRFLKITRDTSIKQIFEEGSIGILAQRTSREFMNDLKQLFREGLISISRYEEWCSHQLLLMDERIQIVLAIRVLNRSHPAMSLQDCVKVVERSKGSRDLVVFVREVIKTAGSEYWNRAMASFMIERRHAQLTLSARIIQYHPDICVILPPRIAQDLGFSYYSFIRIDGLTNESALAEEFDGGEKLLGIFISLTFLETFVGVLMAQEKEGSLCEEETKAWFSNPWIMLDVRWRFAQAMKDIAAVTNITATDIFRWKRGTENIADFTRRLDGDSDQSFWLGIVKGYEEEIRMISRKRESSQQEEAIRSEGGSQRKRASVILSPPSVLNILEVEESSVVDHRLSVDSRDEGETETFELFSDEDLDMIALH
jgi:hypothetical protein